MILSDHIECDVCQTPKRQTNHWIVAVVITPTPEEPKDSAIAFAPIQTLQPEDARDGDVKHLCGHACASKLLSQWLETLVTTERQSS